ncbi:hypothetical protein ASG75_05070 [Rhodanobacter sp. Soil772]|uniref:copper-binding protein n=1 Tax=Rhodanobacter sp. Soil772 TaxID=1736406 RepID=UPI0006F9EB21|nr:copper-binding protein [Rhodanobacter sp. Soil772]KRE87498.1 hypothetical protein ASG75_05070 [Rhodanobacter sp. Soil772]
MKKLLVALVLTGALIAISAMAAARQIGSLASPGLLKHVKVGDKVRFTLRPAGMASTVTSIAVLP